MAFLLPVLVATLAAGSPLGQFVTKQALPSIPAGWQVKTPAPADHKLDLHIRLKEQNLDQLAQRTLAVSDPEHEDYGKHLTKAEVDALTAPTKETVDAVEQWLSAHGINAGKVKGGYLTVTVSVDEAKKLLDADYSVYHEPTTGRQVIRTTKYSLPRSVHDAVAMVQPTTMFSDLGITSRNMVKPSTKYRPAKIIRRAGSSCDNDGTTTDCLRENYNINGYTPSGGKTQLGVTGFLEEVPDSGDLSTFLKKYDPKIPSNTTMKIVPIKDGPTTAGGEGEANLDSQITVPVTYPIENVFYSTGGRPPFNPIGGDDENTNEPYLDWLQYTIGLDNPAQTYSISYGDDERTVPTDYADAVCSQFMKLGARGVSVLTAAGDAGVGGKEVCKDGSSEINKFLPEFPSACPWVTSVGGTADYGENEQAEHDGGGGFSNHFATPDYQTEVVQAYVKSLGDKFKGAFNTSGRAYPDISAAYSGYPIFFHGAEQNTGGTSASTPTVASVIALLNDYLVSSGKKPLGFLNPFLYKKGQAGLRDIAKGHNNACGSVAAFPAGEGWDPATGLGVPDFGKLKDLV